MTDRINPLRAKLDSRTFVKRLPGVAKKSDSIQSVGIFEETSGRLLFRRHGILCIRAKMKEFLPTDEEIQAALEHSKKAGAELEEFLSVLGRESERSAVVLGAERMNFSLLQLLKQFCVPSEQERHRTDPEKDELFRAFGD